MSASPIPLRAPRRRDADGRAGMPPDEVRVRLALARRVADAGGNVSTFANSAGLSHRAVSVFLRQHDRALHEKLLAGERHSHTRPEEALRRLRVVKAHQGIHGGLRMSAMALGLSSPGLLKWIRAWAPDGIDAAIADLEPEDDAAVSA